VSSLSGKRYHLFWAKVDVGDGCWLWTAGTDKYGYGLFYAGEGMRLAHRLSWVMAKGEIPEGLCVLHRCDVPSCVRPGHLFLGTQAENNRDMRDKGREFRPIGERHGKAKLTEDDVREIRRTYAAGGISYRELGLIYGVCKENVYAVVRRKSWVHV